MPILPPGGTVGRTVRSIAAGLVLVLLAFAAAIQSAPAGPRGDNELVPAESTTTTLHASTTEDVEEPFVYRVGLLSSVTAANYWAFYGEAGGVWDAYVYGPTKPSLFTVALDSSLTPETAAEVVGPVEVDGSWQVTVTLRTDMAWSDGRLLTAEDLEFTFETVRRLGLGGAWADSFPATVVQVEAASPQQVVIRFDQRPTLRTWPHAVGTAPIMPEHIWGDITAAIEEPEALYAISDAPDVGGGPLSILSVGDGVIISLANPGYPSGGVPDRVDYLVYTDEETALDGLVSGAIDTILSPRGLTRRDGDRLEHPVEVVVSPGNGVRYLGFNLQREPMADHGFRRAVALLVDREADTFMSASNGAWHDPERAARIEAPYLGDLTDRLEMALAALSASGYTWETTPGLSPTGPIHGGGLMIDGNEPPALTILTPGDAWDPLRPEYAGRVAGALEWLGFRAAVVETDFDTVVDLAFTPREDGSFAYDMYLLGWSLGDPTLPGFYRTFFAADSRINNTGFDSPEFARHLSDYESAYDHTTARNALWAMEEALADNLPYLLLYRASIVEAYRSDHVGYSHLEVLGGLQGSLGGLTRVHAVR